VDNIVTVMSFTFLPYLRFHFIAFSFYPSFSFSPFRFAFGIPSSTYTLYLYMLNFLLSCLLLHIFLILLLIPIIHILVFYFLCCFYSSSCFIVSFASFLIFSFPFFPVSFFSSTLYLSTFRSSSSASVCLPFLISFLFQYFGLHICLSSLKVLNLPSLFT